MADTTTRLSPGASAGAADAASARSGRRLVTLPAIDDANFEEQMVESLRKLYEGLDQIREMVIEIDSRVAKTEKHVRCLPNLVDIQRAVKG